MFPASVDEIDAYRRLFDPHADQFESLIYLRRQDRWLASRTPQECKGGIRRDTRLVKGSPGQFETILRAWDNGSDVTRIRRFDPEFLSGGSLTEDFCQAIGADGRGFPNDRIYNPSLFQEQLELVDSLNAALDLPFARKMNCRDDFLYLCTERLGGHRVEFTRAEVEAAFQDFAQANRWLARRHDPQGPPLFFNNDFTEHPVTARNDKSYSIERFSDLSREIQARLDTHGQAGPIFTSNMGREAYINQVVTAFARLWRMDDEAFARGAGRRGPNSAAKRAPGRSELIVGTSVVLYVQEKCAREFNGCLITRGPGGESKPRRLLRNPP